MIEIGVEMEMEARVLHDVVAQLRNVELRAHLVGLPELIVARRARTESLRSRWSGGMSGLDGIPKFFIKNQSIFTTSSFA